MTHSRTFTILVSILTIGILVVFASPLSARGNVGMSQLQQQQQQPGPAGYSGLSQGIAKPGQYAAGTIASLQNDKSGKPAWIVSGLWKASATNLTSEMPVTNASSKKNLPTASFNSVFNMVMLNGSAMHKHEISNFTLTSISMPDKNTIVYNGTATITMKNGPVTAVPISTRVLGGNAVSIWLDPTKTNSHFGNTPIYGTILKAVHILK